MTNAVSIAQLGANNSSFTNRIINGAMVIDQRNAGAAVTINTAAQTYTLDRWRFFGQASDGVFTVQQSTVAPAGFTNSALITVTTADASIGSTQVYVGAQAIEGFNVADFAWGTASASVVTLSFWVRSSLTGTFSGSVKNSDGTRSYPFTYSIASADTLEYKTVTIPGDTTGTWLTNNGSGIGLTFNLGSGSSRLGTASTWAAANYDGATGSVALISTLNATWYVTGVQLEKGSTATSFDYRPIGQELALCQRYFEWCSTVGQSGIFAQSLFFKVQKRTTATIANYLTENSIPNNWSGQLPGGGGGSVPTVANGSLGVYYSGTPAANGISRFSASAEL